MIDVKTGPDCIVIDAEIGVPRDTVWRALIEEERIAEWWGDYVSFDARPGGYLTERWTDAEGREVLTTGEVVRLEAPRVLELAWADDDWDEPTRVPHTDLRAPRNHEIHRWKSSVLSLVALNLPPPALIV